MVGKRDEQTVVAGGRRAAPPKIDGVKIVELGNVLTRSGWMAEVFRTDWPEVQITVRQSPGSSSRPAPTEIANGRDVLATQFESLKQVAARQEQTIAELQARRDA